ncbi:MAG: TlpA family protein disulfide reductase [Acidobacteriales bacterium]|nr:TlpA family protein disulfide reductase [Terriglobales bacterium]
MTSVSTGQSGPQFSLADIKGREHALAEALKKGPVVLAFFKISCPVCQFTFPFIERIHRAYGNDRVTIWGISQDDARDTKEFCDEYGLTFPALIDSDGYPVSNQYGLTNVPTLVMLSPEGKVKVSGHGFAKHDLESISTELGKHLGRSPEPVFKASEKIPDYQPG